MRCRKCKKKIRGFEKECPYCQMPIDSTDQQLEQYISKIEDEFHQEEIIIERKKKYDARVRRMKHRVHKQAKKVIAGTLVTALILGTAYINKKRVWEVESREISYLSGNGLYEQKLHNGETMCLWKFNDKINTAERKRNVVYRLQHSYYVSKKNKCIYYLGVYPEKKEAQKQSKTQLEDDAYQEFLEEDERVSLYKQDLTNRWKEPELIQTGIDEFEVDRDDTIYYISPKKDAIYKYDGEKQEKIAMNQIEGIMLHKGKERDTLFAYTSSGENIYDESEEKRDIYRLDWTSKKADRVFAVDGDLAGENIVVQDKKSLYFLEDNILYGYDVSEGQNVLIDKNVERMAAGMKDGKECLYYNRYTLETHSYYEMVEDPYKKKDRMDRKDGKETAELNKREDFRRQLQEEKFLLMKSDLLCYQDGKSTEIEKGVDGPYSYNGMSMGGIYSFVGFGCKLGQQYEDANTVTIMFRRQASLTQPFLMRKDGSGTVDEVLDSYSTLEDASVYMTTSNEVYYDWNRASDNRVTQRVIGMVSQECQFLKDGKLNPIVEENEQEIAKLGDATYYYDYEMGVLKKKSEKSNKDETVDGNIVAYQLLDPNTLVVMSSEGEKTHVLYKLDASGKKEYIAKDVWGLFGKDTCYVKDIYEDSWAQY